MRDWIADHGRRLHRAVWNLSHSPFVRVRHQGVEFPTRDLPMFALAQSQFIQQS